jgi:hypothetical protein
MASMRAPRRPRTRWLHFVEILPRQIAVRPRAAYQFKQLVLAIIGARGLGDDLLREHVEWRIVRDDAIELAATHFAHQRRAFDEVIARDREEAAFRQSCNRMAGASDALQERGDAMRRGDLADQIDVTDIDAQLQRGGGHQRFQLPVLQARLGVEALLLGEAAVVRSDALFAEAVAEMAGNALGHAAGIDED